MARIMTDIFNKSDLESSLRKLRKHALILRGACVSYARAIQFSREVA